MQCSAKNEAIARNAQSDKVQNNTEMKMP